MTPQLQQAIKLLQLSRMELLEQVREEMEQNPLLEQPDETRRGRHGRQGARRGRRWRPPTPRPPQAPGGQGPGEAPRRSRARDSPPEIDWEAYLNSYQFNEPTTASNKGNVATDDLPSFEANLVKKEDLFEHLRRSWACCKLNDAERRVAIADHRQPRRRRVPEAARRGGRPADPPGERGRRAHARRRADAAADPAARPEGLRRARPSGVPAHPGCGAEGDARRRCWASIIKRLHEATWRARTCRPSPRS